MTDMITTAEAAAETIAFGTGTTAALPQVIPASPAARKGYDRAVDAVNRLPRPLAAMMALALFLDAAIEPTGFSARMQVLATMPEPMWWLAGAVLTYFFGARETHYLRHSGDAPAPAAR